MTDVEYELSQLVACMRAIGHPIDDVAADRCRRILAGELNEEDAVAEIWARYAQPVSELAAALTAGMLTEPQFTEAVVLLPVVPQTPPRHPHSDLWIPVTGPISELHSAFTAGLITATIHDTTLAAMIAAGHEA
jgi:hypothetical protein